MQLKHFVLAACMAGSFTASLGQQPIVVDAGKITAEVQPTMWGVFFEDINMGADGGLYAELAKNRSFEFYKPLMGWTVQQKPFKEGAVLVLNREKKESSNPRFIRVSVANGSKETLSLTNEGFRGMGIKQGVNYDFSVLYRQQQPGVKLHVQLTDGAGKTYGETSLVPATADHQWHQQQVRFTSTATVEKAKLVIWFEGSGVIDLDMISLFPTDTWKARPGGLRADMVQLLADMKPGFIRFPGGCIVEGYDLANRYQWKKTVGPVAERQLIVNRWNTEFAHRLTPDYYQTFGLGFFEYFQLAEDIGAEALPILNCGMACQFNSAEVVPVDQLDPYVQDALDLIEFANGPVSSTWGKVRADMGHPAPFHLKLLGVGNENWGPQYIERLQVFTRAIKEKYPDIKLVNSSGTDPNGERFDYLNKELRAMNADLIDEHYYKSPEWFLSNASRYDSYPKNGSKVFAGEYAAHIDRAVTGPNRNTWQGAIAEAAFMTGLERNAAVVQMASYAPLFAHTDAWQWAPDMLWANNLKVYGTPDYYVQKLYSLHKGTNVVSITSGNQVIAGQDSLYASAVLNKPDNELIIKLVNASGKTRIQEIAINGIKKPSKTASITVLKADNLAAVNTFENAVNVSPAEKSIEWNGKTIHLELAPYSFSVLRIR
jgi:alpha-L-arabinofuranosidase